MQFIVQKYLEHYFQVARLTQGKLSSFKILGIWEDYQFYHSERRGLCCAFFALEKSTEIVVAKQGR